MNPRGRTSAEFGFIVRRFNAVGGFGERTHMIGCYSSEL